MKYIVFFMAAAIGHAAMTGSLYAGCMPVKSEVVSLGEKAARAYAERSLDKGIEAEKSVLDSTGAEIGRIVKKKLNCEPFPNVLGADEWRCVGEAKVCTKS